MTLPFPFGFPAATQLYLVLLVVTMLVHMVFMHYVLAGTAYLACGRLFGRRRAADCGWQQRLVDWLPFATGLAITAGVAPLLFVQILYQREFYTANLLLSHRWMAILPVLLVCFYLLYLQKSSWIMKRAWGWRIAVIWLAFAGFGFIAWSWTENHLLSLDEAAWADLYAAGGLRYATAGLLPRLAGWFLLAFPTLAVELYWQGRLCGEPLGEPAVESARVMGLAPVQRLAVTGLAGLAGGGLALGLYAATLPAETRSLVTGGLGGLWLLLLLGGLLAQAVAWGIALRAGRLATPLAWLLTAGWLLGLLGLLVVREVIRLAAVDLKALLPQHERAAGIGGFPVFLVFASLSVAAIVWSIVAVRRGLKQQASGAGRTST